MRAHSTVEACNNSASGYFPAFPAGAAALPMDRLPHSQEDELRSDRKVRRIKSSALPAEATVMSIALQSSH